LLLAAAALSAAASDAVRYTVTVKPARILLGESPAAMLRRVASNEAPDALDFTHRSLILQAVRRGSAGEPAMAFPNQSSTQRDGRTIRLQTQGGTSTLKAGQSDSRTFSLLELFPLQVLDIGRFELTYRFEEAQPPIAVQPAHFRVESSQKSVGLLLAALQSTNPTVRARASALLHRMTLQGLDYDPAGPEVERQAAAERWRNWWHEVGSKLPWTSEGAAGLGLVSYPKRQFSIEERGALKERLNRWLQTPSESLEIPQHFAARSRILVADDTIVKLLNQTLRRIQESAAAGEDRAAQGRAILALIAAMPSRTFIPALDGLISACHTPDWRPCRVTASALLDFLDPRRVPVAGGS
jgi:hypothetical protein